MMFRKQLLAFILLVFGFLSPISVSASQNKSIPSLNSLASFLNWDLQSFSQAYEDLDSLAGFVNAEIKYGHPYSLDKKYKLELAFALEMNPRLQMASHLNFRGLLGSAFQVKTYIIEDTVYFHDDIQDTEWQEDPITVEELEKIWDNFLDHWHQYWPQVQIGFLEFMETIPPQRWLSMIELDNQADYLSITLKPAFSAEEIENLILSIQNSLDHEELTGLFGFFAETDFWAEFLSQVHLEIIAKQNKSNRYLESLDLNIHIANEILQKLLYSGDHYGDFDLSTQIQMTDFNQIADLELPQLNEQDPQLPWHLAESDEAEEVEIDEVFAAKLEELLELVTREREVSYQQVAKIFDLPPSEESYIQLSAEDGNRFYALFTDGVIEHYEITLKHNEPFLSPQEILTYFQEGKENMNFPLDEDKATFVSTNSFGKIYTYFDTEAQLALLLYTNADQSGGKGIGIHYLDRFIDFSALEPVEEFKENYESLEEIVAVLGDPSMEVYLYETGESYYYFHSDPDLANHGYLQFAIDKEGNVINYYGYWD